MDKQTTRNESTDIAPSEGTRKRFHMPADKLLLVAGCVWAAAGANILNIGLQASHGVWALWMIGAAILVFLAFHIGVFTKLVRKHTVRISSYDNNTTHVLRFFDKKSYIIMSVMMTTGISLRAFNLLPDAGIAFFYTGLGIALLLAGVGFFGHYPSVARSHS